MNLNADSLLIEKLDEIPEEENANTFGTQDGQMAGNMFAGQYAEDSLPKDEVPAVQVNEPV